VDTSFFEMGGFSMKTTALVTKIHKELDVKVTLDDVSETPTIKGMSQKIKTRDKEVYIPIVPVEKNDWYPLPSLHRKMVLDNTYKNTTRYNTSRAFDIRGKLDPEKLTHAFQKLIERHEIFRTTFHLKENEPVQKINPIFTFKLQYRQCSEEKALETVNKREFIDPFDLSALPLLRVQLLEITGERHFLLVDMHHIVTDAVTDSLWYSELFAFYEGAEAEPLSVQFKDYATWQKKVLTPCVMRRQANYWLGKL
ncbi:MAG: hypothetical protein GY757_12215, partial [bacterium]|nr:hypothetical protein [bacterium]